MFVRRQNTRIKGIKKMQPSIFLSLLIAIIIAISACSASEGSIVILENPNGEGFTMDFRDWNSNNKCTLSLNKGDILQIEIACEEGEIELTVSGQNGSEPYTGNNLKSILFTVKVSERDNYDIRFTSTNATGKVTVKKMAEEGSEKNK